MRKLASLMAGFALLSTSCIGGGGETTILVDYSHDEFPSFVAKNFPKQVAVHPGTELVFKQTWTGEPHSVTGGTLVNALLEEVRPFMEMADRGEKIPEEPPKEVVDAEEKVAPSLDHRSFRIVQTGAQPCYLARGEPRKDGKPCKEQDQPDFTGKQSFYNSGLLPYEGPKGNEYRLKLADDIDPGSYWFYCNYHGSFQSTEVIVKPKSEKVPTAGEVTDAARDQVDKINRPFKRIVDDASDGKLTWSTPGSKRPLRIEGNFAGLSDPALDLWHSINAFIPKRLTADAGKQITWNVIGNHSISFGVPKYFPIFTISDDGTVTLNDKLDPPAGGAKKFDLPEEERYIPGNEDPIKFDGGTYDGNGFWSSGTMNAEPWIEYSMRIADPGTYRYACLIHPAMVGTVEVT